MTTVVTQSARQARSLSLAACVLLAGCGLGRGGDRQELIQDELRSLGVSASPLVASPSVAGEAATVVELTYVGAVPLGATATLAPFRDAASSSSGAVVLEPSAINIKAGSETYTQYSQLQIMTAKIEVTLPEISAFADKTLGGQVEYGFSVTAAGRTEQIIGNLLVVPKGQPELAWTAPSLAFTTPSADNTVVTVDKASDIAASVGNPTGEPVIVGWFTSDGQIANRRAASTTWTPKDAGAQTLIAVVHGVQSRGFSYQVREITSEGTGSN